jgi:hypothetical protein
MMLLVLTMFAVSPLELDPISVDGVDNAKMVAVESNDLPCSP